MHKDTTTYPMLQMTIAVSALIFIHWNHFKTLKATSIIQYTAIKKTKTMGKWKKKKKPEMQEIQQNLSLFSANRQAAIASLIKTEPTLIYQIVSHTLKSSSNNENWRKPNSTLFTRRLAVMEGRCSGEDWNDNAQYCCTAASNKVCKSLDSYPPFCCEISSNTR